MRGQTKIAVAIGAVLIVALIAYIGSGNKQAPVNESASNTPADQPAAGEGSAPTIALSTDLDPSPKETAGGTSGNSSDVASPSPRRVDDGFSTPSGGGAAMRPEPAETDSPSGSYRAAELPGERPGLSTVVPDSDTSSGATTAHTTTDVPPNADKDARPTEAMLPPISPLNVVGSDTATTRPSNTPPVTRDATPKPGTSVGTGAATNGSAVGATDKPAEKPGPRTHVIKKGDTYSSLAAEYYGSTKYVKHIEKANPGKSATKLYIGAKIVIPEPPTGATVKAASGATTADAPKATPVAPPAGASAAKARSTYVVPPVDPGRSYTVQPGEGWFDLAAKFLGKGENYPKLYEYNKERVGGNPDMLRAGTVIELPPGAKLPAATTAEPTAPPAK